MTAPMNEKEQLKSDYSERKCSGHALDRFCAQHLSPGILTVAL